ncbi:MAG: LamG domain-containing protein [Desulfobacteraceae bacterium]|nr:MAG: LamG domain-containing protein [Desulfobacteraceae bacterium]
MMSKKLSLTILAMFFITALFSANSILAVDNTVLYLQGEGATIKDTSGKNYQITINGNTMISTTQKKFGNSSIYFDGSGDYLTVPASADWDFGSGDLTIDSWIQIDRLGAHQVFCIGYGYLYIWDKNNGANSGFFLYNGPSSYVQLNWRSDALPGEWIHFAVVRSGNTAKVYENGVQKASANFAGSFHNNNTGFWIGQLNWTAGTPFKGYLDEFRITKGQALWTANFTPPAPTPTVTFSASKDLINNSESVTLNWTTLDASGCTLQYNNTNQVVQIPSGTLTLSPNAPTTYTLIATGPGGTAYKELTVKVLNGYTTTGPFTVATKVGIGVMNPQNALEVNGTIKAKEVQVSLSGWADYVFNNDYNLRSLEELEAFIRKNGRLPDMPSTEQLTQKGLSVTEMFTLQMKKIEELTLYLIKLQQENQILKTRLNTLEQAQ